MQKLLIAALSFALFLPSPASASWGELTEDELQDCVRAIHLYDSIKQEYKLEFTRTYAGNNSIGRQIDKEFTQYSLRSEPNINDRL